MIVIPGVSLKGTLHQAAAIAGVIAGFTDYAVYLFDDRSNIEEGYTLRKRASDIASSMDEAGLKDTCVYAASMGGMVAQCLAIDRPDLVKKLFIVSTYSRPNPSSDVVFRRWNALAREGRLEELIDLTTSEIYSPATVEKMGDVIKGNIGEVSEEELRQYACLTQAILNFNIYDELEKIQCPVLAAYSLGDKVLFPVGTEEIIRKTGCRPLVFGAEYGHAVYDEYPGFCNLALEFFEESVPVDNTVEAL